MFLIKVEMDYREAQRRHLLDDCQSMHRFVTGLFGTDRQSSQILYRTNLVQNKLYIYLYSQNHTKDVPLSCKVQQQDTTPWLDQMTVGQIWGFDLITAPSKKVKRYDDDGNELKGQNSRRRMIREPIERRAWLESKAEQNGFQLLHVEELEQIHVSGKHKMEKGGRMVHSAFHYQGILRIKDTDTFRTALQTGIGPGKAYGFGMMMVKRI